MSDINELRSIITIENVATYGNALIAYNHAKRGKKHYKQVELFEKDLRNNLMSIVEEFRNGTYRTGEYVVSVLNDGRKPRVVAKVPFRDRVAQWMIAMWYEPYFQALICPYTHAAIKHRGIHSALRQVEHYVRVGKYTWCIELDVKKYFPHVNRTILNDMLREDVPDDTLYIIIKNIINDAPDSVVDDFGNTTKDGIPIGNYWSQYMANRYMVKFTKSMEGIAFVQYMDDIRVFGKSLDELRKLLREIEWVLLRDLNLNLKPNWQIFRIADRGIDFVGYRVFPNKTILRKDNFLRMRKKISAIKKNLKNGSCLTESQKCTIMSYLGQVAACTTGTREYIYSTCFAEALSLAGVKLSKKLTRVYL